MPASMVQMVLPVVEVRFNAKAVPAQLFFHTKRIGQRRSSIVCGQVDEEAALHIKMELYDHFVLPIWKYSVIEGNWAARSFRFPTKT
jgi:hypothetical protein